MTKLLAKKLIQSIQKVTKTKKSSLHEPIFFGDEIKVDNVNYSSNKMSYVTMRSENIPILFKFTEILWCKVFPACYQGFFLCIV